jgi:hypothetical protein
MMRKFHKNGMLVIPSPVKQEFRDRRKILVVNECYCQHGHSLISKRAVFSGHNGIMVWVWSEKTEGLIAISPIYGDKSRVAIDVDIEEGAIYDLCCPVCGDKLPVCVQCKCGGNIIALFTTTQASFSDCIGICNRAGCDHAEVRGGNEVIEYSMIETFSEMTI